MTIACIAAQNEATHEIADHGKQLNAAQVAMCLMLRG